MSVERRPAAPCIAGTAMACVVVLVGFALVLHALTGGFKHWTFDDMRREYAAQGRLQATAQGVRTAQSTHRELWKESDHEPPVMLVNFIYTTCPTVCSALGSEFTQMQAVISKQRPSSRSPIELVSISFDTEHDDAAQLAAYARVHHADSDVWTIAAPTSQEDSARLLRELGVVVVRDGIGGYVHNGSIHVMTATGRVKAIYDAADWQAALAMATRLATAAP